VTANDQVYENLDIVGFVGITTGLRAVFRRCRIRLVPSYYAIKADLASATSAADGALFEDCEIDGGPAEGSTAIYGKYLTLRRCNIHGGGDVLKAQAGVTVEESWLHDAVRQPGGHHDIVQITSGNGISVLRSRLDGYDAQAGSNFNAALMVGSLAGPVNGLTWHDNYIDGGNYVLNYNAANSATHGDPVNVSFRRNVFGPHFQFGRRTGAIYSTTVNGLGPTGEAPFDASNVALATGVAA
jgi:hypothetical protein